MNTEGIVLKNVEFDGALLRAAQVENIVWVGIRWVCLGLGLSRGQINHQVNNIQKDELLSRGCTKFSAGSFDENNETLAIQLDYLPAWLFKISITPKMKKDHPELVRKLIRYQLKAKDVLAQAFLPNINSQEDKIDELERKIDGLNIKFDNLYNNVSKMGNLLIDMKEHSLIPTTVQKEKAKSLEASYLWKQEMYEKMDILVGLRKFESRAEIMKYIYKYMNRNYGIVWEQEIREYIERSGLTSKPATIDVIYDNKMLKSIFGAVLSDMTEVWVDNEKKNDKRIPVVISADNIIQPLIKKNCDLSNAGMATYRVVYKYMDDHYKVGWKNLQTRYCNKHRICGDPRKISRKQLIESNEGLRKKFEKAVNELLEG